MKSQKNLLTFWNLAKLAKSVFGSPDFQAGLLGVVFMGALEPINFTNVASDNTMELHWEVLLPKEIV